MLSKSKNNRSVAKINKDVKIFEDQISSESEVQEKKDAHGAIECMIKDTVTQRAKNVASVAKIITSQYVVGRQNKAKINKGLIK